MKLDKARRLTNKELAILEKRITKAYRTAYTELTAEWRSYMAKGKKRLKSLYNAFINASPSDLAEAKKAYQDALQTYTLRNQYYQQMVAVTVYKLARVNQTAIDYSNDILPKIYTLNYNQIVEDIGYLDLGIDYTLVNEDVLKRRFYENDITTPFMHLKKHLNIPKDERWNTKQINSSILQGIIQGESMDKIAERILPIVNNNEKAAIRNARTMVTGAENVGRLDSFERLEEKGVIMRKVWIATADSRTRDWHLSLDGQEVDPHDYFVDGNGDRLRYPGDPSAPGRTVYNCRCAMRSHILGIRSADGEIIPIDGNSSSDFHKSQISSEKAKRR